MQKAAIVSELRTDRVDQRDGAFSHAMYESRDADSTVGFEDQRVEPRIGYSGINHIDSLQAGNGLKEQ